MRHLTENAQHLRFLRFSEMKRLLSFPKKEIILNSFDTIAGEKNKKNVGGDEYLSYGIF